MNTRNVTSNSSKLDTIATLNTLLSDTTLSGKTKSLYAYMRQGMDNSVIYQVHITATEAGIPEDKIIPFTLYIANFIMNGSSPLRMVTLTWYDIVTRERVYGDVPTYLKIFDKMRASTLDKWNKAIDLIDTYKLLCENDYECTV